MGGLLHHGACGIPLQETRYISLFCVVKGDVMEILQRFMGGDGHWSEEVGGVIKEKGVVL